MKKAIRKILGKRLYGYLLYSRHHHLLLSINGVENRRADGEKAYIAKWHKISYLVEPYSYRLFSRFCGPNPDIIPEDILHLVVEPAIAPSEYWEEYEDKNNFARIVGAGYLPQTVISRQHGQQTGRVAELRDCCFDSLILKASLNTSCGDGIMKFDRVGEEYSTKEGIMLTQELLDNYGQDFVLQEAVEQHHFMSQFNPSSVNTIRIALYRRLEDDKPMATAAVLRIGAAGSHVDNILSGGRFVSVDVATGKLGHYTATHLGQISEVWNGVDFSKNDYMVPGWERFLQLADHVGRCLHRSRLAALDIALRADGTPVLIEYNIGGFSSFLYHFTGQTVFGNYTDEVISLIVRSR